MNALPPIPPVRPDAGAGRPLARRGEPRFRRINAAFFLGGFSTFSLLYCVQPLMPLFARVFAVSPAGASLSLSATTTVLAIAMFAASALSERFGRKRVMTASLAAAALTTLAAALAPGFASFVTLRALTGLALSGVPALAMAYLAEEIERETVGFAMGLYIAGSVVGGLSGRLASAALADAVGWRGAIGAIGALGLLVALGFALALPTETGFARRASGLAATWRAARRHLADPGLRDLFALGFLLMGSFVCTYNYIGFRLGAPPFSLSQTTIGFVFVIYLVGVVVSPLAGELAGRFGRRKVVALAIVTMPIGVATTLADSLPLTIFGAALVTGGFFAGHTIASSWVGLRADEPRALASALYLFFYYLGSSVVGSAGGWAFERGGWPGVAALTGALTGLALLIALRLSRVPPPPHLAPT